MSETLRLNGAMHAVVLRSGVAPGLIRRIDAAAARAGPGMHAVITAQDVLQAFAPIPVIPMRQETTPQLKPDEQLVIAHAKVCSAASAPDFSFYEPAISYP